MIHINNDTFGRIIIMHFQGTMTREVLKDVEEAWDDQINQMPEIIALDFRDLAQIDSICINHIFKMARIANEKEIKLVIYDVFESLKKIFEVIKLDKVITIMTKQQFDSTYLKFN